MKANKHRAVDTSFKSKLHAPSC